MSSQYNPLGVHGLILPPRPSVPSPPTPGPPEPRQVSDYQRQLRPIMQEQEAEELGERRKIQPVQMIFDILQRGQYGSANLVRSLLRGDNIKDLLTSVWKGVTGQEKTSYEDVIRETYENRPGVNAWLERWRDDKIFKNAPEGSWRSQLDKGKIAGFLGDIFLDPTTYIGFGASKGATKAARTYADDVMRVMTREMGQQASEGGATKIFQRGAQKTLDRGWKKAYREALRTGEEELRENLLGRLGQGQGLESLMARLQRPSTYEGAGKTAWNFGLLGQRQAGTKTREGFNRVMDNLSHAIKENPASDKLANAWWSVMNRGPMKAIRAALNIRSPYQKVMDMTRLAAERDALQSAQAEVVAEVAERFGKVDDETGQELLRLYGEAYARRKARPVGTDLDQGVLFGEMGAGPVDVEGILGDPMLVQKLGIRDPNKLREVIPQIKEYTEPMLHRLHDLHNEGFIDEVGEITDYLPMAMKSPSVKNSPGTGAGFRRQRKMTLAEHTEEDVSLWMWLTGASREQAQDMVKRNSLTMNMNFRDLMLGRGLSQAKLENRVNIIKQFREFGVAKDQLRGEFANLMRHSTVDIPEVGLKTVNARGLENYVFDYEAAKILERALGMTEPRNVAGIAKAFVEFTSFFKRIATMSTGFHLRNLYSNQVTQFLKHGGSAFDPKVLLDTAVGLRYALHKGDLSKVADDIGVSVGFIKRALNRQHGNFTTKELADVALQRNVISRNLMLQEPEELMKAGKAKLNPMSKDFAGVKASRWAGERVENFSRFQSFLMDYGDTASAHVGAGELAARIEADDEALKYAADEAKKWFMDYGDLSVTEKKYMSQVLPFYTWIRKNLSNQIQAVALYPELFSVVPKVEEFFTYEHPDYDPDFLPDWMKNLGMFPTGQMEDGSFRMFNPNFPYQDLNRIPLVWEEDGRPRFDPGEIWNDLVSATNPAIQTLMSAATGQGYDFFHRRELEATAPAPYLFRLLGSNKGIIGMWDAIQRYRGLDSGMHIDDEGKLQINAQVAQALQQNMPLLRTMEFLFYLPQNIGKNNPIEQVVERITGAQDSYEGAEETLQLMSYFLGIKFKPADLEEEKARFGRDIYYRSRDILNEQRGSEVRRMRSRNETDRTIRRLLG